MKKHHAAFILILFYGCSSNPLKIDVSGVKVPPVKIDRLERDIFTMPEDSVRTRTPVLLKKYGKFYVDFVKEFLNNGGFMDSNYSASIKHFKTDRDMRNAYDSCEKEYPEMLFLENGMTEAFKHFRYYFPDMPLPRVVTVMSGFNYSLVYSDSTLGIGLEMYLGKNNGFYLMLGFPKYKVAHLSRAYMLSDALYGWLESIFPQDENKSDLLAKIVHEGKIMYLLDALLPDMNDSIKIRFSEKQLRWCKENEFNMWAYIIKEKLLYSASPGDIAKFTDDGPFTSLFNHDLSPARTGNWLGWQIIRSYMKKNREVTPAKLLAEKDADEVLHKSGYKPSR